MSITGARGTGKKKWCELFSWQIATCTMQLATCAGQEPADTAPEPGYCQPTQLYCNRCRQASSYQAGFFTAYRPLDPADWCPVYHRPLHLKILLYFSQKSCVCFRYL